MPAYDYLTPKVYSVILGYDSEEELYDITVETRTARNNVVDSMLYLVTDATEINMQAIFEAAITEHIDDLTLRGYVVQPFTAL